MQESGSQKLPTPEQRVIYQVQQHPIKYQIPTQSVNHQQLQPEADDIHEQYPQVRSKKAKYPEPTETVVQYVDQLQPLTYTQPQLFVHYPEGKTDTRRKEMLHDNSIAYKPRQNQNAIRYRIQPSLDHVRYQYLQSLRRQTEPRQHQPPTPHGCVIAKDRSVQIIVGDEEE